MNIIDLNERRNANFRANSQELGWGKAGLAGSAKNDGGGQTCGTSGD
jgi:hypothetical protein